VPCNSYQVFIRDNNTLQNVQQVSFFKELTITRRKNKAGYFRLVTDPYCGEIKPQYLNFNYGIDVWRNGKRYFSGRNLHFSWEKQDKEFFLVIEGADDNILIDWRIVLPSPYKFQTSYSTPYWYTSGSAEYVIKQLIETQLGSQTHDSRKIDNLRVEPSISRGETIGKKVRFDYLRTVLDECILHIDGYNYGIVQEKWQTEGEKLVFKLIPWLRKWKFNEYIDSNGNIVRGFQIPGGVEFSARNQSLVDFKYVRSVPDFNAVLVGGGQEGGTGKEFRKFAYTKNEYSRALFPDIEYFEDRRGTTDTNELSQVAWEALRLPKGKENPEKTYATKATVEATIKEVDGMRLGVDWDLGDWVRVVLMEDTKGTETIEVLDFIKEITITLTNDKAEEIRAVVGSDDYIESYKMEPFIRDQNLRVREVIQKLKGEY
jgi:hypothetical protein